MKIWVILLVVFMAAVSAFAESTEAYQTLSMHALKAIKASNTTALSALLEKGLQINEPLFYNGTALDISLHYAVTRDNVNLDMIQFLLDNGADRTMEAASGRTGTLIRKHGYWMQTGGDAFWVSKTLLKFQCKRGRVNLSGVG